MATFVSLSCSSASGLYARGSGAGSRLGRQRQQARRTPMVRASGGPDLNEQWRRFKQSLPEVEQNVVTKPPPGFQSRGGWNDGTTASNKLRQQESQVLNAWTQERLMQLAAGGTMVLVLVLLFAAGGPPSDSRCTLPWC